MPTFKLPARLAAVLGTLDAALIAASTQLPGLSPEAHMGIVFVLALFAALGIHPTDSVQSELGQLAATLPPPDGAGQAAQPGKEPL
jgi:hypothetical protein